MRIGSSGDVGLSGAGSGSKLSTSVIVYLSFASRLGRTRGGPAEKLPLSTKQGFYSLPSSFLFACGVLINFNVIKSELNFRSSVGGNCLALR